jgi:hypothetical protein
MSKIATTYNNMFIKNDYIQALKGYYYHHELVIEKEYIYKRKSSRELSGLCEKYNINIYNLNNDNWFLIGYYVDKINKIENELNEQTSNNKLYISKNKSLEQTINKMKNEIDACWIYIPFI